MSEITYDNFLYFDAETGAYTITVSDNYGHSDTITYTTTLTDVPDDVTDFTATWDSAGLIKFAWENNVNSTKLGLVELTGTQPQEYYKYLEVVMIGQCLLLMKIKLWIAG